MADYLTKNCSKCLLGISILNESISNFNIIFLVIYSQKYMNSVKFYFLRLF